MWMKIGDAAMGIVARLESGREREAPGQVREETPKEGILPEGGTAPAGRRRAQTVHTRSSKGGGATGNRLGCAAPAAPIASAREDGRNG